MQVLAFGGLGYLHRNGKSEGMKVGHCLLISTHAPHYNHFNLQMFLKGSKQSQYLKKGFTKERKWQATPLLKQIIPKK